MIVNPYLSLIKGKHGGGVRGSVAYSTWTCDTGGAECSWQVDLRGTPQSFRIGEVGHLENGRFLVLRDPYAKKPPKQIDLPVPRGLITEAKLRRWFDAVCTA
ncbi:MAG: hypothetical protein HQL32_17935, partial [Planctomycetes bacterium]|nr:hypothetical protein [Planctomycetota bacterium]